MSGLSDTSAFEAFNRMADKIEEEERKSLAQAEVTEALAGDTLETEFLRLESGPGGAGVEDQLLALKAEMGLIAPPEREAPKQLSDGDDDEAVEASGEGDGVVDAQVEDVSEEEADSIPEAELLSEFDKLEGKQADA
jgi:phage shock protein A